MASRTRLAPGDTLTLRYAGGGGCGDPRRRDREVVRGDREDGYISAGAARDAYGLED